MIIKENENSVRLCCGGRGCPAVTLLDDGRFEIHDDYGSSVVVKSDEMALMTKAAYELTNNTDRP